MKAPAACLALACVALLARPAAACAAAAAAASAPSNDGPVFTTDFGSPVFQNNMSLTIGPRGPVLVEDFQTMEKIATFGREKIAERVVHARGVAAKGFFEVTGDITNLTFADIFSIVGKKTDVIARLSTVLEPAGAPEWTREPRGFAVKFYTTSGNWDLVGCNFPVFFVRDAAQFPDLVHALKTNPVNHLSDPWRTADFLSFHPESMNMVTYLFDDVGIPQDYRHMNGSSVNTYTLINANGTMSLVKFHWRPLVGEQNLLEEDIGQVASQHPDGSFASQDLYEAIEAKSYPEWQFFIQTIPYEDQLNFDFDPLDATKIWPENEFPLQMVGRMVLNQNVDNFFNENEQLAFSPAHTVPGIGYSADKMLQWRLFAYDDTQRHRIGPNFALLPVNRPRCPMFNIRQDGPLNFMQQQGPVNYYPSTFMAQASGLDQDAAGPAQEYPVNSSPIGPASMMRAIIDKQDDFSQPGARYRYYDPERQARFAKRLTGLLTSNNVTEAIVARWQSYLQQIDAGLAAQVSEGVAMAAARNCGPPPAPALGAAVKSAARGRGD